MEIGLAMLLKMGLQIGMNNTSLDKIIVTDPSGATKMYNITHFLKATYY
tara:strand:+ start:327 stop:473 length:147 start_codon:yes stop_codon:yes gene_type:complete